MEDAEEKKVTGRNKKLGKRVSSLAVYSLCSPAVLAGNIRITRTQLDNGIYAGLLAAAVSLPFP